MVAYDSSGLFLPYFPSLLLLFFFFIAPLLCRKFETHIYNLSSRTNTKLNNLALFVFPLGFAYVDLSGFTFFEEYLAGKESYALLIIPGGVLKKGSKYKFQLTVNDGKQNGTASMEVEVRKGPAAGSLTVDKPNVAALFEEITISGNKIFLKNLDWSLYNMYKVEEKIERGKKWADLFLASARRLDYLCLCIKGDFTKLKNIQDLNGEDKRGMNLVECNDNLDLSGYLTVYIYTNKHTLFKVS